MWRNKKVILATVMVAALIAVSIGGVVMAADDDQGAAQETKRQELMDRVFEIYEEQTGVVIDQEIMKDAFIQAKDEMRQEAMQDHLDGLVEEGVITQAEADEYMEWLESKPDIAIGFGGQGHTQARGMCGPGVR